MMLCSGHAVMGEETLLSTPGPGGQWGSWGRQVTGDWRANTERVYTGSVSCGRERAERGDM